MRVLIAGANGYTGARIYSDLAMCFEVCGTYHKGPLFPELVPLDTTVSGKVGKVVRDLRPDWIINATGIANPRFCDEHKALARAVNVRGTKNLIKAANKIGARLIHISTGQVMAQDGTCPLTKLEAERAVISDADNYDILRPGLILGQSPNTTNDRYHNRLLNNIMKKEHPTYDNSTKFQLTWLGHITEVLTLLIERDMCKKVIPVVALEQHTRYEISKDILDNFKIECSPSGDSSSGIEIRQELGVLKLLEMPMYKYDKVIGKVVGEIQDWLAKNPKHRAQRKR